MIIITLYLS